MSEIQERSQGKFRGVRGSRGNFNSSDRESSYRGQAEQSKTQEKTSTYNRDGPRGQGFNRQPDFDVSGREEQDRPYQPRARGRGEYDSNRGRSNYSSSGQYDKPENRGFDQSYGSRNQENQDQPDDRQYRGRGGYGRRGRGGFQENSGFVERRGRGRGGYNRNQGLGSWDEIEDTQETRPYRGGSRGFRDNQNPEQRS